MSYSVTRGWLPAFNPALHGRVAGSNRQFLWLTSWKIPIFSRKLPSLAVVYGMYTTVVAFDLGTSWATIMNVYAHTEWCVWL